MKRKSRSRGGFWADAAMEEVRMGEGMIRGGRKDAFGDLSCPRGESGRREGGTDRGKRVIH